MPLIAKVPYILVVFTLGQETSSIVRWLREMALKLGGDLNGASTRKRRYMERVIHFTLKNTLVMWVSEVNITIIIFTWVG